MEVKPEDVLKLKLSSRKSNRCKKEINGGLVRPWSRNHVTMKRWNSETSEWTCREMLTMISLSRMSFRKSSKTKLRSFTKLSEILPDAFFQIKHSTIKLNCCWVIYCLNWGEYRLTVFCPFRYICWYIIINRCYFIWTLYEVFVIVNDFLIWMHNMFQDFISSVLSSSLDFRFTALLWQNRTERTKFVYFIYINFLIGIMMWKLVTIFIKNLYVFIRITGTTVMYFFGPLEFLSQ